MFFGSHPKKIGYTDPLTFSNFSTSFLWYVCNGFDLDRAINVQIICKAKVLCNSDFALQIRALYLHRSSSNQ